MEELLTSLKNRSDKNWLIGYDNQKFYHLIHYFIKEILDIKQKKNIPKIFIVEANYHEFLAAFLACVITKSPVFLCNHQWKKKEWKQVFNLVQPDLILGDEQSNILQSLSSSSSPNNALNLNLENLIMIPTGGSSGDIRFTVHTWQSLSNSVQGFIDYFEIKTVNSFCCLPLYHVSGLIQFFRSFLTKGKLTIIPYSQLKQASNLSLNLNDYFISLVPTQLQFLLELNPQWLAQFKTVFLGGAPPWSSLLETARNYKINLALTYGMTETASQVVTLKPQDFLKGNNSTGKILPHAQVTIFNPSKTLSKNDQAGIITLKSTSLFSGYYPNIKQQTEIITDDLGYFDSNSYLYIIGRNSQKIITGGENVFPIEVEQIILATGLVKDVGVIGIPDDKWGQAITAVYVPNTCLISSQMIKIAIQEQLSQFKQPKYWISVDSLPRNQQGKINYKQLQEIIMTNLEGKIPQNSAKNDISR